MKERIAQLMELLPAGIDAAIIQSDLNRRYFSGMQSSAGTVLLFREEAYLIIDFRYIEKARKTVTACQVIEQKDLNLQIRTLLKKHHAKTLAVESMEMTLQSFYALKKSLGSGIELIFSDVLSRSIYQCRMVKSEEEIDKIRQAQRIAEAALEDTLKFIRPGVSEWEVMLKLNQSMLEHGSDGESFPTIALTGTATSMPHGVPQRDRLVQEGDFVLMDFGAMVDGYHSDMTRTVAVGKVSDKMQEVYEVVQKAQAAGLEAAKAGITGKNLDKIARDIITDAGYGDYFGHSLGHGVGLEIHEYPNASPSCDTVLQPNHIVTVEPGIYLPGEFGVRIEDFVVIHENDCEDLTLFPHELIVLE